MQYSMVMVKVDSNAILVEPFKNCTSNKLERAYLVLLDHIKRLPGSYQRNTSQTMNAQTA